MKKFNYDLNVKDESLILKVEASKQDIKILNEILYKHVFSKVKGGSLRID